MGHKAEWVVERTASVHTGFRALGGAWLSALLGSVTVVTGCANLLDIESDAKLVAPDDTSDGTPGECEGTLYVKLTTDTDTDGSGSARDIAPSYNQGIIDYIEMLNGRPAGGIRGCEIDLEVGEGDDSAVRTEQVIGGWAAKQEWDDVSTLFLFGTGAVKRVAGDLAEEGKLVIAGASSGSLASPESVSREVAHPHVTANGAESSVTDDVRNVGYPNVFFVGMDDSTIARGLLAAISNHGGGRVALVADRANNCDFCEDPLIAVKQQIGSQARLELGRDINGVEQTVGAGDEENIQGVLDDYFQWEIDAKLADPSYEPVSWLWLGNSVASSSLVGRAVPGVQANIDASVPEEDRWTVRLAANPWGFSEETPELCGDACNGILIGVTPVFAWGETERSRGMSDLMGVHNDAREAGEEYRNHHYVRGYAAAMMWHRAVERALDGGSTRPTGDDIRDALNEFRDEEVEDLTAGPLSFDSSDHRSQTRYNVYAIDMDGNLVFDSDGSVQASNLWLGY